MNKQQIYKLCSKWPQTVRFSSPARARTVRRAIYIERAEVIREVAQNFINDTERETFHRNVTALRFRVNGPYLHIELKPESPSTNELDSILSNAQTIA